MARAYRALRAAKRLVSDAGSFINAGVAGTDIGDAARQAGWPEPLPMCEQMASFPAKMVPDIRELLAAND